MLGRALDKDYFLAATLQDIPRGLSKCAKREIIEDISHTYVNIFLQNEQKIYLKGFFYD